MMQMKFKGFSVKSVIVLAIFCLAAPLSGAQEGRVDSLVRRGDSLRMIYDFENSISAYGQALAAVGDSLATVEDSLLKIGIEDLVLLSENGRNMARYAYSPKVVARHQFSIDDFFLYYPLKDSCWRPAPNVLDTLPSPYSKALYMPDDAKTVFFSAQDENGIRNIYRTSQSDSLWALPTLLNEDLVSASDEIYPMVSQDGKTVYFASKGLFGVGGFDLYMSEWDEEAADWSAPVNMGFPYSSPANDFLLTGSDDGKYMVFASDRGCPADSVMVYVLEQEAVPVRSAMDDPSELRLLSLLEPSKVIDDIEDESEIRSEIPENVDTRKYMDKMSEVRALRDSLSFYEGSLEKLREKYSESDSAQEKEKLAMQILQEEERLPAIQSRLDLAVQVLQDIEMDFLFSGVVIDPDKLLKDAEREVVGESTGYVFSKMSFGPPLSIEVEIPEPEFDYSFKILDQAQVLRDTLTREGLVYQIQIMSADRQAPLKSLKGLSPVFETVSPGGRYTYRVGLFHEYKDVLQHLNAVKRLGFRSAFIVATIDGVEKKVAVARNHEAQMKAARPQHYRVVIAFEGELDPVVLTSIRQQVGEKDIARVDSTLVIGPFGGSRQADELVRFVEAMGYGQAKVEVIE